MLFMNWQLIIMTMKQVSQYINTNKAAITHLFRDMSQDDELPATKLYTFLQEIFKLEQIFVLKEGKNYYEDD